MVGMKLYTFAIIEATQKENSVHVYFWMLYGTAKFYACQQQATQVYGFITVNKKI